MREEYPCHCGVFAYDNCPVERRAPARVRVVNAGGVGGEEELHDGVITAVDGFVEGGPTARV